MKSGVFRVPHPWAAALVAALCWLCWLAPAAGQDAQARLDRLASLDRAFQPEIQPLLQRYCYECHSGDVTEADIDLVAYQTVADVRKSTPVWQKLSEMLDSGQMPPVDARQPTEAERRRLQQWVRDLLTLEAEARSGDPGRVVLRRLSNAEYTYTVRDLTGIDDLDPARQFPTDGAAGEGFTNTGAALVMSPALITKYLEAAKEISQHAVLLPDGFRFSTHTTRRDWTNETLADIRQFYAAFTDSGGGDTVNLQGIVFDTNQGGRLPVEKYLEAALANREGLIAGRTTVESVAQQCGLSAKYFGGLWRMLTAAGDPARPSLLLDPLRSRWRDATPQDAARLAAEIARWQQALWKFNPVGHIGKVGGPRQWMEAVDPLTTSQEFRFKLPSSPEDKNKDVMLYLTASDAGDGNEHDEVLWERPRLVSPGRPDLLLRDLRPATIELAKHRDQLFASAAKCLSAAVEAGSTATALDVDALARKYDVSPTLLSAWLDYLGIGAAGPVPLGAPLVRKAESASGYDFIQGWVGDDALSVMANASDEHVRIPGNMRPHGIAVHPAPTLSVAVGWRSPLAATLKIEGVVQHAHPECGNGVAWSLELRRGNTRQRLAAGVSQGATPVPFGPLDQIAIQTGDVVSLAINPRDGNHACDLTAIDLTLDDGAHQWNLARDLSPHILAGNPHADSYGNAETWHFFSEPAAGTVGHVIPAGSLLAKWQSAGVASEKQQLADQLQSLLQNGPGALPKDAPDAALYRQLTALSGPLLSAALHNLAAAPVGSRDVKDARFGLDPDLFGQHPRGLPVEAASLWVQAPAVVEVRLPADLLVDAEFVTTGRLNSSAGPQGSVQLQVSTSPPQPLEGLQPTAVSETTANGPWTSNNRGVSYATPVIVGEGSPARSRMESSFEDFRSWFPAALCYTKIVPVDEVVTLTLFYREDDQLQRLMLDEAQIAKLDRLWDELHFISYDALTLVDAFAQLLEYASQDADPKVFEPLREPINDRADAFRQRLIDTEPAQLDALIAFAPRAYRRPLTEQEVGQLRTLYASFRSQEIPHLEAFRLTLARILLAPAFLYRIEEPVPGAGQGPVSDYELASRLSYFLWASQPDDELLRLADARRLSDPDTLLNQTRRLLSDGKTRRLAIEFACQWLHLRDFDQLDEKSERHFPTFAELRSAMYEESIQFFTDLFQNDGSVLGILDADHAFLNEALAAHYGIPDVSGPQWRRVDGVRAYARGGILTLAATLSKQSGASRTSPILRGNWISEVILGERLPRPPKNVPQLADAPPDGLTERQLIERHSSDASCAKCHARIDPFGFALENFDAIGRFREHDASGLEIDTRTTLPDGSEINGLDGLRTYLLTERREAFLRQFTRKLLGYALGRAVQLSDEPLLAEMRDQLEAHDYHIGAAVEAIVKSRQFREIRGRDWAYDE